MKMHKLESNIITN